MSPISIALNLLLAGLLMTTLLFGWVLNRRLKALKDSHAGFAEAVAHLDRAAGRAEAGLSELRVATDQAVDLLTSRIMKARDLAESLDRLTLEGAAVLERRGVDRPSAPPTPREIAARIAAERGHSRLVEPQPMREPQPLREPPPRRRAPDLAERFAATTEDEALAAAESLILKLSRTEALTTATPPRYATQTAPRLEPAPAAARPPAPELHHAPRAEPPPVRANPRSRAHVDDDLFEPSARGRLRAFDGGLA